MPRTLPLKRWTSLAWTCFFLLAVAPGTAQVALGRPDQQAPAPAAPAASAEEEVRAVNERRFAAMVKEDFAELDRLLADDLTYIHSSGIVETKKESMASIAKKVLRYVSIQSSDIQVRVYGDTAVMTGRVAMSVLARGKELDLRNLFTAVYVRQGGEWRLTVWQSTAAAK